jgi:predicted nucleic acid-binding protein
MTIDAFIDTNVLLYAVSNSVKEIEKKWLSRALLEQTNFGLSAQVLQEFYVNATGKLAQTLPEAETMEFIRWLEQFPVVPIDMALFHQALEIRKRYRVSYWDAAILAAARTLGAATLYSEDLSHGQMYDGVRVVNPFWELEAQATPPSP